MVTIVLMVEDQMDREWVYKVRKWMYNAYYPLDFSVKYQKGLDEISLGVQMCLQKIVAETSISLSTKCIGK